MKTYSKNKWKLQLYLKWVLTEYESILSQESLVANKMVIDENNDNPQLDIRVTGESVPPPHYKYEVDRFLVTSYNNDNWHF